MARDARPAAKAARLLAKLANKTIDAEQAAADVIKAPALLPAILDGMASDKPAIKYGCAKVLRVVATEKPSLLYPRIDFFVELLDHPKNIMKWEAIHVLGELASVDRKQKIDAILDRYLAPISGPALITAANIVGGAAKIACAKPALAPRIVTALKKVEKATYKTPECTNVCLGGVIDAFDRMMPHVEQSRAMVNLVKRQIENPRPSTRKRAERFLKRWAAPTPQKRS